MTEILVKGFNYFKSKSTYESEVSAGKVESGSLNFIEETGEILIFDGTFGGGNNNGANVKAVETGEYVEDPEAPDSNFLKLSAYWFDISGTYTKSDLEKELGISIEELVKAIFKGKHIYLISTTTTIGNLSYIIESNVVLNTDESLNYITLVWHQYELWNTLTLTNTGSDTYTASIVRA